MTSRPDQNGLAYVALAAAVVMHMGGAVQGQDFIFGNQCGDGQWFTTCNPAQNVWRNNWGRLTATQAQLAFPEVNSVVLLSGTVNLNTNTQAAILTNPVGTVFNWSGGTLACPVVNNAGSMVLASAGSTFLPGTLSNAAGGTVRVQTGTFFLSPGLGTSSLLSDGHVQLSGGGGIRRNGSTAASTFVVNNGLFEVLNGASEVNGLTFSGATGSLLSVTPSASLSLLSCNFSGVLNADIRGPVTISGMCALSGNTTLATTGSSTGGWSWIGGDLTTGGFSLNNQGLLLIRTTTNHFLSGAMNNGEGGEVRFERGSLFLTADGPGSAFNNAGLFLIDSGAGLRRSGGSRAGVSLVNTGVVRARAGSEGLSLVTEMVVSGDGRWETEPGATLRFEGIDIAGVHRGDHSGVAKFVGSINLVGDTTLANVGSGSEPWRWISGAMVMGNSTLHVPGRLLVTGGTVKSLDGRLVANPGGVISVDTGVLSLAGAGAGSSVEVAAGGRLDLVFGGSLLRSGGTNDGARLVNNGEVNVPAGPGGLGGQLTGLSILGDGLWTVAPSSMLALSGLDYQGTLTGSLGGTATMTGPSKLKGDTSFRLAPGSVNAWRWVDGTLNCQEFEAINSHRFEFAGEGQRSLIGRFTSQAGSLLRVVNGTLTLIPPAAGQTVLTNNGTLRMGPLTNIVRGGGTEGDAVLVNNGLIEIESGFARISGVRLANSASGVIRVSGGQAVDLPVGMVLEAGRLEGAGTLLGTPGLTNTGGTVAPGDGPAVGELTTPYRYVQGSDGTFEITVVNIGGVQAADRLVLTSTGFFGEAGVDGTLRVSLPGGAATPLQVGNHVVLVAPGGLSGTFSSVVCDTPVPGYRFEVEYTSTQAVLRVRQGCGPSDVGGTGGNPGADGVLDNNDFIVFIDQFFDGRPAADVGTTGGVAGSDGLFNNNDFIVFIDRFFAGCG